VSYIFGLSEFFNRNEGATSQENHQHFFRAAHFGQQVPEMTSTIRRIRRIIVTLFVIALALNARAEDWPQWRGSGRDGVWHETGIQTKPINQSVLQGSQRHQNCEQGAPGKRLDPLQRPNGESWANNFDSVGKWESPRNLKKSWRQALIAQYR
jgi:hypothetical protein